MLSLVHSNHRIAVDPLLTKFVRSKWMDNADNGLVFLRVYGRDP